MADIRKILIIFVVGILFAVFVFSFIEAVYPNPEYSDYCDDDYRVPRMIKENVECEVIEVSDCEGDVLYEYDSNGCASSYECSTCRLEYDDARKNYNQYVFYISALLALVAIFIGLYLPAGGNTLNEWIGTGFMLGGIIALLFGTARSFNDLHRFIRPVVILLELVLVIFISYRKVGNLRPDKRKK